MEQSPSGVRKQVLAEHDRIRALLADVDDHATRVLAGETERLEALCDRTRDLARILLVHLSMEEQFLAPCLRTIDAWGQVRADRMLVEHERQRAELRQLVAEAVGDPAPEQLAQAVADLVAALRVDMEQEERDLLAEDLLRDDLVSIDQSDG